MAQVDQQLPDITTTFPNNWKELIRPGPPIFHLYLQYLYDGQIKYGPSTVVFMQVGMFHEMYGVENEYMTIGLVSQMAHDLNIQMTRRKKTIIENSPKNYLMAGFPSVHLDRYINILVEDNWTVIIVDQIEDPKSVQNVTSIIEEDTDKDEEEDESVESVENETETEMAKTSKPTVKNGKTKKESKSKSKNKKQVARAI